MIFTENKINKKIIAGSILATVLLLLSINIFFDSYRLRSPIILQSPIEKRQPVIEIKKIIVTPTSTPTPTVKPKQKTEKEIINEYKLSKVLWGVYGMESTWGKNDDCRLKNKGYGGFGVMDNEHKVVCYETFEKAVERANYWITKLEPEKNLVDALCIWNLGAEGYKKAGGNNCQYYQTFLTL